MDVLHSQGDEGKIAAKVGVGGRGSWWTGIFSDPAVSGVKEGPLFGAALLFVPDLGDSRR